MKRETHVTMLLGYQLAGCELLVAFDRLFSNCASKRMPSSFLKIWVFPKIGVPQNGWFVMENPIKMDDLGVPLFLETPISQISQKGHIFCWKLGFVSVEIDFVFFLRITYDIFGEKPPKISTSLRNYSKDPILL